MGYPKLCSTDAHWDAAGAVIVGKNARRLKRRKSKRAANKAAAAAAYPIGATKSQRKRAAKAARKAAVYQMPLTALKADMDGWPPGFPPRP